jgi:DNA modification methylase
MTKVKAEDKAIAVQELPEGVGQLFYIETAEQLEAIGSHDPGHLFVCYVRIPLLGDYYLAGNSKRHDLQSLQDSIYRHGFKISLLYDPLLPNVSGGLGAVQCGNGRVEDLLYIYANRVNLEVPRGIVVKGEEWYAPVSFGVNDQTREDAIAFSIHENVANVLGADGFTALDLTRLFNDDQLKAQLGELMDLDVAFPVGLEAEDLSVWLGLEEMPEPQPEDEELVDKLLDDAEDGKIESRVKLGEIWACGRHRVACGDSTDEGNIQKLLAGRLIDLIFTDPPYGVSYADKNKSLNAVGRGNRIQTPIANDHLTPQQTFDTLWLPVFSALIKHAKAGCSFYVCAPQGGEQMMMMMALNNAGWLVKHELIWVKNNHVLGRADYHYKHEPIIYGWKPGAAHYFIDSRSEMSVWNFDKPNKSDLHPTMKPVGLVIYALSNSTQKNEVVFDAFLGSGTTIIAAQQMQGDRTVFGFELSEAYCEVILRRYEQLTGEVAQLVGHL